MNRLIKLRIALYGSEALAVLLYLLARKLGFSPLWALLPLIGAAVCNWLIRKEQLRAAAQLRQEQAQPREASQETQPDALQRAGSAFAPAADSVPQDEEKASKFNA